MFEYIIQEMLEAVAEELNKEEKSGRKDVRERERGTRSHTNLRNRKTNINGLFVRMGIDAKVEVEQFKRRKGENGPWEGARDRAPGSTGIDVELYVPKDASNPIVVIDLKTGQNNSGYRTKEIAKKRSAFAPGSGGKMNVVEIFIRRM